MFNKIPYNLCTENPFFPQVAAFAYLMRPDGGPTIWLPNENTFIDPSKKSSAQPQPFPPTSAPASVYLSLVVPAYNEVERLPIMLDETLEYLHNRKQNDPSFTYEVLVVDDGSKDITSTIAGTYVKKEGVDTMRLLTLQKNRGKGGAVKRVRNYAHLLGELNKG